MTDIVTSLSSSLNGLLPGLSDRVGITQQTIREYYIFTGSLDLVSVCNVFETHS